jgi:uncharacterized protein YoxC
MQQDVLWLVVAISVLVIAVSVAAIAWALIRLANEAGRTAAETHRLMAVLQEELPLTLAVLQRASGSLDQLAAESAARLLILDQLGTEASATMVAARELSTSVNELVRGPADTVTGVKRSARMVGGGIATGADRLRRVITGDHEGTRPE